jgi:hypothetical protein
MHVRKPREVLWVSSDKTQGEHNWSAFGVVSDQSALRQRRSRPGVDRDSSPRTGARITRYELSNDKWSAIKSMLPNKPRGVPRVSDRRVLNGIFWVLRSGAPWRDLPGSFGP